MMSDNQTPPGWYPAPHSNNEQRYWDGRRWSDWTPEQAAAAAAGASTASGASEPTPAVSVPGVATATAVVDAPPATPEKKKALKWWVWVLIGFGALVLLIIIIGSLNRDSEASDDAGAAPVVTAEAVDDEPSVDIPEVVGMTVGEARSAIEAAGLTFQTVPGAADDWVVQTQDRTVPAPAGSAVFVTATSPEPPPAPEAPAVDVPTQVFDGTGDNVVEVNITAPAIVTFDCPACTRNTILKTNGSESLLVNEIGAYRGQHLINAYDNSMTTRFTVEADGAWSILIEDLTTAEQFDGAAWGTGDRVIYMTGSFDVATITNEGDSNFLVYAYGTGNRSPLIVNEIGAYSGTVEMVGPAFVQVESTSNWSIAPQ
jgi:hypothetical protein